MLEGGINIIKPSVILGIFSGLTSICLWVVLNYVNPYSNVRETGVNISTLFMLLLPACLMIFSSLTSKRSLMLFAFIWSLPFSLYFAMTPGIFAVFGVRSSQ